MEHAQEHEVSSKKKKMKKDRKRRQTFLLPLPPENAPEVGEKNWGSEVELEMRLLHTHTATIEKKGRVGRVKNRR